MRFRFAFLFYLLITFIYVQCSTPPAIEEPASLTFATFNVSMEAENYLGRNAELVSAQVLIDSLAVGNSWHIKNIARIIQTVRPDVLLLNEFDYIDDPQHGIEKFIEAYLNVAQDSTEAINYPYYYYSTSNTGIETPYDLNGDGKFEGIASDAYGYGRYPGHYGMVVLSRYPIEYDNVRTFQKFKWKDMPNHMRTINADGEDFYSQEAWQEFRLSSKSHWDIPIKIGDKNIHVLASHPTPPGFDGEEDRNGKRNHDEIRFWTDYIDQSKGAYIYDDQGLKGALGDKFFVIMGDLNASPNEGSAINKGINDLINHAKVNNEFTPASKGGEKWSPDNPNGKYHTALWRLRADYVLPSSNLDVTDHGVFWPTEGETLYALMSDRTASSDHRMVWVEISLER